MLQNMALSEVRCFHLEHVRTASISLEYLFFLLLKAMTLKMAKLTFAAYCRFCLKYYLKVEMIIVVIENAEKIQIRLVTES